MSDVITPDELKTLIPDEVGDFNNVVTSHLNTLWKKNAQRSPVWLQYLYTKRDAIRMLMGAVWRDVNVRMLTRQGIDAADKFEHLKGLLLEVNSELTEYVSSGVEPSVGNMTQTSPEMGNCPPYADPNDPIYRGDPVRAQIFPRWP